MMRDTLNKILGERENAALIRRVKGLISAKLRLVLEQNAELVALNCSSQSIRSILKITGLAPTQSSGYEPEAQKVGLESRCFEQVIVAIAQGVLPLINAN